MNRTSLFTMTILALFILLPAAAAQAKDGRPRVCNQTNVTIWAALGWKEGGARHSEGWTRVDPGGCQTMANERREGWYMVAVKNHLQLGPQPMRPGEGNWEDFCVHVDPLTEFNFDEDDCNSGNPDSMSFRFGYVKDLNGDGIALFWARD